MVTAVLERHDTTPITRWSIELCIYHNFFIDPNRGVVALLFVALILYNLFKPT